MLSEISYRFNDLYHLFSLVYKRHFGDGPSHMNCFVDVFMLRITNCSISLSYVASFQLLLLRCPIFIISQIGYM